MPCTVNVCDYTDRGKPSRFCMQICEQADTASDMLSKIAEKVECRAEEIEVIFCGQKLAQGNSLDLYNITSHSTLYVFRKDYFPETSSRTGTSDVPGAHEVLHTLQKALQNPAYRKTVDQILITQGALQKMMAAVPGLASDPAALSMLQDPELLSILAHRQNIHRVLKAHPAFGPAALYVAAAVDEEHTRDSSRPNRSAIYSLDQMSDEEGERHQGGAVSGVQQITASQLAAALAEATASSSTSLTRSQLAAHTAASTRAGGPAVISPDFFQQAMLQAQNAALDAQLQQLRDMGITDENIARQALNATGGDLQAALDFIFGDNSANPS